MRLLRLDFTHVPTKELTPTDALSRAPELCVENILIQLPASDKRLQEIATGQK